jgi:hypothetical protein
MLSLSIGPLPGFPFERVSSQKLDTELITINPHQLAAPIREFPAPGSVDRHHIDRNAPFELNTITLAVSIGHRTILIEASAAKSISIFPALPAG